MTFENQFPKRLQETDSKDVYAVYAQEINVAEGEEAISWMLLTTEIVETIESAKMILRWYSYRWLIEEYHKIQSVRMSGRKLSIRRE